MLVQRNLSGDPGKAGCAAEAVEPLVELAVAEGLDVAGLMGVATEGSLDPVVAQTYPLADLAAAQERFLAGDFVGKLVIEPNRA